jgi:adenosylhomocysteine nucleosidase
MNSSSLVVVLISARQEWKIVCEFYPDVIVNDSIYGDWFFQQIDNRPVIFFHSGVAKVAAAASTQYAIDQWKPGLLVNLGTCGGFAGDIERGEIVLVDCALVYDIVEQMSDPLAAIERFTTRMDLSWLNEPYPHAVRRGILVSGDRDIIPGDIPWLRKQFGASAGDWESGAIAWVAARMQVRCLILRGVSDLVDTHGGEAYGNMEVFENGTRRVMQQLMENLPGWLARVTPETAVF